VPEVRRQCDDALQAGDPAALRGILGLLIERPAVERLAFGRCASRMTWAPTGLALAQIRERAVEAA
jgi:hypothetical protein